MENIRMSEEKDWNVSHLIRLTSIDHSKNRKIWYEPTIE